MEVSKVNQSNFDQEVLQASEVVLVDFYADWCGPCKMMAPVLEEIAKESSDIKVAKVNVDENPELASQYKVMSIPSFVVFKEGKVADSKVGAVSKDAILSMCK